VRSGWEPLIWNGVGLGEPELADVENEGAAALGFHVPEEFGFVEHLRELADGRGQRALFLCLPVGAPALEKEFLGCFGDFAPVDRDGGGRGRYKAEITRVAHCFEKDSEKIVQEVTTIGKLIYGISERSTAPTSITCLNFDVSFEPQAILDSDVATNIAELQILLGDLRVVEW